MVDQRFNNEAKQRQVARLKAEREAEAERQRREAAKEAARRKPHCSGFSDDLGNRIIARAERHERALAQIRSGKKNSSPTARQRWDRAIEAAALVCGGDRGKAVMMADRENPGLREKMLAEVNKR